ncbi:MAG: PEP-utilizing enzyme [Candidatus Margulisiibacteriota bacterium]|jgi:phosphohistidine swiveling domain-containing protein
MFGSKAQNLEFIADKLTEGKVLPLVYFTVKDYQINPKKYLDLIEANFQDKIIIRSSAKGEDNLITSNAGGFISISNVDKNNAKNVAQSIEKVIASYKSTDINNQVLVQPMLKDIAICGVVFTADLDTLAPYYIINYDESGSFDSVTGGNKANLKTYVKFKYSPYQCADLRIEKLIAACKECEDFFGNNFLDIEFAFNSIDELFILQVRPIVQNNKRDLYSLDLESALMKIEKKLLKISYSYPNLLGDKAIYGVMPDWNPAEIIGKKPKALALSLYKELVTDKIWAYQRDNYGYRNLRSHPLMMSFLGVPYIDVRVSFNSFVPKDLDEKIAYKLVNYYLNKLAQNTNHHDKIEFEIVFSCYYLGLADKLQELLKSGFNKNEIKRIEFALLNLTNKIIHFDNGHFQNDLKKIDVLEEKFLEITNSKLALIDKIYLLIENCKRYGTLPFAGIARAAFVAVQILKSLVATNLISENEYHLFLNSLNTVSKQLTNDVESLLCDYLSKDDFIMKYGHLRPGTYDITSLNYEEGFDHYFKVNRSKNIKTIEKNADFFRFSSDQIRIIDLTLKENGILISADELFEFIKEAVEAREYSKFVFTKTLSYILKLIEELGKRFDISRDDLSYLNVQTLLQLYSSIDNREVKDIFCDEISANKKFHEYTTAVKMPNLILNQKDIYEYFLEDGEPNFVTLNSIESKVIVEKDVNMADLTKSIIFIRSADPGYDFLFARNIGGLITQYGGANSHMAIRCAELNIPAVIGAGENNFKTWQKANTLFIDAANKQVKIIS